jgi:hypothetical protein
MAEPKKFTGAEFVKALSEKTLAEPIVLEGMAKQEDGNTNSFMFSVGTSCTSWVQIPLDIVENIELLRVVGCKDHTHPFIKLYLKEPPTENSFANLFTSFVKKMTAPAAVRPIVRPAPTSLPARPEFGYCYGQDSGCPSDAPCAEEGDDGEVYCTDCCIAATVQRPIVRRVRRAIRPTPRRRSLGVRRPVSAFDLCWYVQVTGHCNSDGHYMSGSSSDPSKDVAYSNASADAQDGCYNRGGFSEEDSSSELINCGG